MRWLLPIAAAVCLAGCQVQPARNPNDPNEVSADKQPDVIEAYMKQMSEDVIRPAVAAGQVTDAKGREMMVQGAKEYLKTVHIKDTPPSVAWKLGEAFMAAEEWQRAEGFIRTALQTDTTPDRLVHDRIWLARCEAELGIVDAAIKDARSSFVAPPPDKWPILYAVYLEIVPAAERAHPETRLELAKLVEDAIKQHRAAEGSFDDLRTRGFVIAREHHISLAWSLVVHLYEAAGRPELARAAAAKAVGKPPKGLAS